MKRRVIEAITYPRMRLLATLDLENCPQCGIYNPVHPACRYCEQLEDCRWLTRNDEFSALTLRPMDELMEALVFCIDFVATECNLNDHNIGRCVCEACTWVRDARALLREYRGISASQRYAI